MKRIKNEFHFGFPVSLQEEFAPYRGSSTDVVARVVIEPVEVPWVCGESAGGALRRPYAEWKL